MRENFALDIAPANPFVDLAPLIKADLEWKARELELLSKMPIFPSPTVFLDPLVTFLPILLPVPEPF